MKRISIIGMINLLFLILIGGNLMAADLSGKKVVVISGVSEESSGNILGYKFIYDGINEVLKPAGITPVYQWVEMDTLPSDEAKTAAADEAIAKARAVKPDLIVTLNDDALKFIGARIDDIPVIFSWVFGAPSSLGMPKDNVTGIIRKSYAVDIWRMAKRLMEVETVGMLSKYSLTVEGVKKTLLAKADLLEKASGVRFKDMIMCNTFDEWQKAVKEFPYDLLYLADTSRITKDGKAMNSADLTAWTVANAKVPVIAAAEKDVAAGALYSIVTSENGIGKMVAETAIGILNGGEVNQAYQASKKGKFVVNLKTAVQKKTEIPYEILATADKVYE